MFLYMDSDLKTFASKTVVQVLSSLQTNADTGLTTEETANRLKETGPNLIPSNKKESRGQDLLLHFKSHLVILLLIAAGISFSISENISIIILIVIASVLTDFFTGNLKLIYRYMFIYGITRRLNSRCQIETGCLKEKSCKKNFCLHGLS